MRIESTILNHLLHDDSYARKVIPFLKEKYFVDSSERLVFKQIESFVSKYNSLPTKEALLIELNNLTGVGESEHKQSSELIDGLTLPEKVDETWLLNTTEKFCQEKAVYNAIMDSIHILDGKEKHQDKGNIPQILTDALSISFDNHIGHDFLEDFAERYDFYHRVEEKVLFDLDMMNKITRGGFSKKSLNIVMAGCVHPDTKIRVRLREKLENADVRNEKVISIGEVAHLLQQGYDIEVDSPDGWVGVNAFIDKGIYQEYVLKMNDPKYKDVRCNADHLFETRTGWVSAKDLVDNGIVDVLTRTGYASGFVSKYDSMIPIVDINVEHKNRRYYTEDISSHNTGVGKTLLMCHFAAANMMLGKNVLYITMEMAEEKIAERIDANLLNVSCEDLANLSKDLYETKVSKVRAKTVGKLIIKEYPTATAHVGHFRHLLNELNLKRTFKPDIIYLDYLNISMSSRVKPGANINSYTYIKSIAEELRGLAVEFNVPIVSATQTTRSGFSNSDPDLTDTSESFGLPATADFMIALISSEELQNLNQIMIKQLKNRYNDLTLHSKFVVGIDRSKFRLYDVEQSAQEDLIVDKPAFDKSKFGSRANEDDSMRWATKKQGRKDFSGFK